MENIQDLEAPLNLVDRYVSDREISFLNKKNLNTEMKQYCAKFK